MNRRFEETIEASSLVARIRSGDPAAREELFHKISARMEVLARKMLDGSRVRRWEQTGDLVQETYFRLQKLLDNHEVPVKSTEHLLRLVAQNMRFRLIEIFRKNSGPEGIDANYQSRDRADEIGHVAGIAQHGELGRDPSKRAEWAEFHEQVGELPEEHRQIFDLRCYLGLTHAEIAEAIGTSEKTAQRRWSAARQFLIELLDGKLPDV